MEVAVNAMRAEALPTVQNTTPLHPRLRLAYSAPAPPRPLPPRPAPARPQPVPTTSARPLPASAPATTPIRLTRRGRVVVAVMAALLVAVVSLIAAGAAQATSHSAPRSGVQNLAQVVVGPGQSLWSVAEGADPNADTRVVIQQIVQLNSLSGDTVFAGQRLWVPRG